MRKLFAWVLAFCCIAQVAAAAVPPIPPSPPAASPNVTAPRLRFCSTFGGTIEQLVGSTPLSNGTSQTSGTNRFAINVTSDCGNPQFLYMNSYVGSSGLQTYPGTPVTIHDAIELGGNLQEISFGNSTGAAISSGGRTGTVISDGGIILSQPAGGFFAKGSTLYLRQYMTVATGTKFPLTMIGYQQGTGPINTTDPVNGTSNNNGSDQSTAYSQQTWSTGANNGEYFAPMAVVGQQTSPSPVFAIIGHSIAAGFGSYPGLGLIGQGLQTLGFSFQNEGISGSTSYNRSRYATGVMVLAPYADDYVWLGLTNDVFNASCLTVAACQANLYAELRTFLHVGSKVWLVTELPRPNTTDGGATYTNQSRDDTVPSGGTLGYDALLDAWNNHLADRTSAGALAQLNAQFIAAGAVGQVAGVIDIRTIIERNCGTGSAIVLDINGQKTAGTGGCWLTNGTTNYYSADAAGGAGHLIHPTQAMVNLLAPAVSASAAAVGSPIAGTTLQ